MLPVTQIYTFYNGLTLRHSDTINVVAEGTFMKRRPEECYDLIKNMAAHHNDWDTSAQRGGSSSSITSSSPEIATLTHCETCGRPHHYSECQAAGGFTQGDIYVAMGNFNACANQMTKIEKSINERPQGALPSKTIPNPQEDIKVITTRSGITLAGPSVPPPNPPSSNEVERDPKPTIDQVHISSSENTARFPSLVVQLAPISKSKEIPKRNPHKPPIPYPSRLNKDKLLDKSDIQIHKFLKMFKKLHFNISLVEALALMPKYAKILKDLLTNKEKLLEMANTPLNENCSVLEACMALADLELAKRSVAYPAGIAEDVFVQVGKFTFPADFVVIDYDVDPHVPLILGRPFLRTTCALIDVHGEELIMRVCDEKLTFKVDSTLKYSHKYGKESINMIDIFDTTCDDHFHEVLNFQKLIHPLSGNPTPSSDLVVAFLSPSFTPFGDNYEAFCFDINHHEEEISGSTISYSDPSILEYESFYFDLLIDPTPIVKRSNSHHEEFVDELAHIISPPEYDHFYFHIKINPGELTRHLKETISSRIKEYKELKSKTSTKKLIIHELNDLRLFLSDCDSTFSEEFFEIDPLVSFPFGNKDNNFDPKKLIINGVYSKRSHILLLNDFSPISFISDILFLSDPSEIVTFLSFPSRNEDKVFDPEILLIDGVLSFTRKSPHLFKDIFKIDKRHSLSEISSKTESSISFHPMDNGIRG
ncbi:reverse transcriptase domain-containing protein [Tanacetum coccineum]